MHCNKCKTDCKHSRVHHLQCQWTIWFAQLFCEIPPLSNSLGHPSISFFPPSSNTDFSYLVSALSVHIMPPSLNNARWLTWQISFWLFLFVGFHFFFFTMPYEFRKEKKLHLLHFHKVNLLILQHPGWMFVSLLFS